MSDLYEMELGLLVAFFDNPRILTCPKPSFGKRVVGRVWLELDIAVPRSSSLLSVVTVFDRTLVAIRFSKVFQGLGRDETDLFVGDTELVVAAVQQRVDVQHRLRGFASEFAEFLGQDFMEVVRQVILRSEKDDASLRNCGYVSRQPSLASWATNL